MAIFRAAGRWSMRLLCRAQERNTREENEAVKAGQMPKDRARKPAKNRQNDKDARWTKKHGKSKLIRRYDVTAASVHDRQRSDGLLKLPIRREMCTPIAPSPRVLPKKAPPEPFRSNRPVC